MRLIFKEILHRKLNFSLSLLAMMTAIGLFVAFFTMTNASIFETRRLTRDMGFNLRIIPSGTDMNDFWLKGFSEETMPEEYVNQLAQHKDILYAHVTATLHKRINWQDAEVILTGLSPELEPSGAKKAPMLFQLHPGTVSLGYELAQREGLHKGDSIVLFGQKFEVQSTLAETGSSDDIRIYLELGELQKLVNMEGQINEIKAINCLCLIEGKDPLDKLREQLHLALPGAKVTMNRTIATAREKQRVMTEQYFAKILPVVLLVCAVWIGAMAWINVNDRKQEIGILRAMGYGTMDIAGLFLGKAVLIGLIGAIIGFAAGSAFSLMYGPDIFEFTANKIKPIYSLLFWSLAGAPVFASLASFLPTTIAISQDPAVTLREE
ncbi:FtsX-like permease family protein [Rapidithrix thailandica]|uniref:FtsX-like permease family protein n=1 Tax=Rapidithrix thailandica TaxID=413964 RepID=A0AAW9RSN5_9BACT